MQFLKNTFLLLFSFLAVIVLFSCKKANWYDVKTDQSLAVPGNLKDFQALMDNANAMNSGSVALGEVGSDGHYVRDQNVVNSANALNAYTWSRNRPYTSVIDWYNNSPIGTGAYEKIYYANLTLEGLLKIESDRADDYEAIRNIRGQALFHRARSFYELSQVFAPPYHPSGASTDLGIPLRLESDINIPSKRATVEQTYRQIIADLMVASDLLPLVPKYKTRPSKPAVFALLARIYLSMEDYNKAGLYADSCLRLYDTLVDYNTRSADATLPFEIFNPEVIFHSSLNTGYNPAIGNVTLIEPELYEQYENGDLRKSLFYTRNATTGIINYKGTYSGTRSFLFSGLATDEIYLIRAECYARSGSITGALKDLNDLLRTRWNNDPGYTDFTSASADEILIKVLTERKKELLLRGLRWSDLRRLNRDERFKITLSRTVSGITYTLEPDSYKYTLPIPDDIIQLTGMPQNKGWEY